MVVLILQVIKLTNTLCDWVADNYCQLFFSVASLLAGKKMLFKAKIVQFVNKSHQLVPIRLQGPPVISKWV